MPSPVEVVKAKQKKGDRASLKPQSEWPVDEADGQLNDVPTLFWNPV